MTCCKQLETAAGATSPFGRMIALGFYDGPTGGVAECAYCHAEYVFEMLDWDDGQDVRVFSFAPLPAGSFEQVVSACPQSNAPPWPVWVPIWKFSTEEERQAASQRVDEVVKCAGPPEAVIAWEGYAETILAARPLTVTDLPDVKPLLSPGTGNPARDWFVYLGLVRKGPDEED
jgi:hypothetical protein